MKIVNRLRFWGIGLALVSLAGCQSGGFLGSTSPGMVTAPGGRVAHAGPRRAVDANRAAENIRVFLADTRPRAGWTPVHMKPSGVLYVRTDAVIDRRDLIGIQSATDHAGGGILVLILSDSGFRKVHEATAANPGLRLALVVGQTMLSAPAYAAPIREQQLAFSVGSARNAEIAARAVAGVR
ncbi:MAG: hypothetical protein EPN31_03345 [Castellaniella sp.]|uniref:hypothetical protein n=1 Tax=Castellaniella sp. TaxID=1955812 RepID=UPI0011F57DF3|nr:hypothetical protein [Castellaniella sp.]TAN30436.1 MAG: hypothetical protein EPN31_03345 [Castellaniella sp.]